MKYTLSVCLLLLGLFLIGCASDPTPTPQTVISQTTEVNSPSNNTSGVAASGVVKPGQAAQLSFAQGGWVQSVDVAVGDQVELNEAIAQLEGRERLEAAITSMETELLAAQQALKALDENASMAKAQAYQAIIDANDAVGQAKLQLYNYTVPTKLADLEPMQALDITKENLDIAREAFEPYKHKSSNDEIREDLKDELDRAQSEYNAAMRWVRLEGALVTAQASLQEAQLLFDKLADGPDPDQVLMAQARLENAQAQLAVAKAALDQVVLKAPFNATVVSVDICSGEAILPGQMVVVLGDLSHLQVETSDLSERDVSSVEIGQPVMVYVEALGLELGGTVARIAPQADTIGGDVVYAVLVELDEQPAGLRWGMSVDVEIDTQ